MKLYLQNIGILLLITFVGITVIPSFATTHYENFQQFYTNQTIFKGDTITVNNTSKESYQVDADGFGSGSISPNGTYTHTFNTLGNIAIMDDLHRGVLSFINVIDPIVQPVIFTNNTTYKQGDLVNIRGTGLIPTIQQSVTIYDSNGRISQVVQTPIISDRTMFLPVTISPLGSIGEWKVVLIQNSQVITTSFMVTQGLTKAVVNDTVISSPVLDNNTAVSNNNTLVTQVASNNTIVTNNSQEIKVLSDKIDALTTKINTMTTQQLSMFGLMTKLAHFFGLN